MLLNNSLLMIEKLIMSLTPTSVLSKVARDRCVANLKELPSFVKDANLKRTAAVLVPICIENGELCLLYTLRSENLNSHKGQVSFPGGKCDNDETAYETALRETEEEIGIPPQDIDIWGKMCRVQGRNEAIVITPVIGEIKNFDMCKLKPSLDEVSEIFTIPFKVLCDSKNHANFKFKNLPTPVFDGGKHRVWGITAMITHLFLTSLLPQDVYKVDFPRKTYQLNELIPNGKL